ncbi:MAG: phosphoenolpyruvate--protein phosphotransferase [Clostridia bacterium]|nr:phosphoenolpyruvate--protein phosphotransferase [Clostridia bacterium]
MLRFKGNGVYGAYAIGKASVFKRNGKKVCRRRITSAESEIKRLENAKKQAISQLNSIYEKALHEIGEANAQIFEIHMMMVEDEDYNESILNIIKTQLVNAEYAVAVTGENFAEMFSLMDDSYMQARATDVKDISNRIIACLVNKNDKKIDFNEKIIICADDLAPSETVSLNKDQVIAFVTEQGTGNSHTAILARNMNIPAVVNVGEGFLETVKDADLLIIDGYNGDIIINPDKKTIEEYELKQKRDIEKKELLQKLKGKENITLDGKRINVFANIGSVDNIGAVLLNDAGGIGLFRSEFLYLEKDRFPTEDEQFYAYKKVLESMGAKKVIIRTLDIGADKQIDYFNMDKEENPALGLRAIRICLSNPDIFKTQLRALYRASVYGNLGIMFPMITSENELKTVLSICDEVKKDLKKLNIKYSHKIEIGIMIETPASAIISDKLAPLVDFFSVGTNDLTQYTLACDRQNPKLAPFCDIHNEAIFRLIRYSAESAHKYGKWIGICGELAADTTLTEEFLKMGIDELSVSPSYILKLRDTIRNIDLNSNKSN